MNEAGHTDEGQHDQGDGQRRAEEVTAKDLFGDGPALRPSGGLDDEDRCRADDRRQQQRRDEHRQPQHVFADQSRCRNRREQECPDVRQHDSDDGDRPDDRSEGDQREHDLAILRHAAEQQDRRPTKRCGQQFAGEPAQHSEQCCENGHRLSSLF